MSHCNRMKTGTQGGLVAANPRDSWPSWTDRPIRLGLAAPALDVLAPRPRSYLATTRAAEVDQCDGPEAGVLALLDLARVSYRVERSEALAAGGDPEAFAAATADVVIWADDRVVAVVRPRAEGSLDVLRLAAAGPLGSAVEGGAR